MLQKKYSSLISPVRWIVFLGIITPLQACAVNSGNFFQGWINIEQIPREVSSVVFYDKNNRPIQALGRDYHEGVMQEGAKCKVPPPDLSAAELDKLNEELKNAGKPTVCIGLYKGVYDKPFAATIQAEHHGSHRCRIYIQIAADYAIEVPQGCGRN